MLSLRIRKYRPPIQSFREESRYRNRAVLLGPTCEAQDLSDLNEVEDAAEHWIGGKGTPGGNRLPGELFAPDPISWGVRGKLLILRLALQAAIANTLGRIAERVLFALAVRLGLLCVGLEPGLETIS